MLDEPSAGLDPESRFIIEQTIAKMESDILIVAMHEYSPEFLNTFNRIITMKDGKIAVF